MSVEVNADDFYRLSKALKAAGQTGLRKELNKGLKKAGQSLIPDAQAALRQSLPSGLGRRGRANLTVQVRTGRDPGVTVGKRFNSRGAGIGHSNAVLINRTGEFRHPVFGHRDRWVAQRTRGGKGWFDDTMRRNAPRVRPDIERAIQDVIGEIVKAG